MTPYLCHFYNAFQDDYYFITFQPTIKHSAEPTTSTSPTTNPSRSNSPTVKICYSVQFHTHARMTSNSKTGIFEVHGYGEIPSECHSEPRSSCVIDVCNADRLIIDAKTPGESWKFSITGPIEKRDFPTVITYDYESRKKYNWVSEVGLNKNISLRTSEKRFSHKLN